MRNRPQTIRLIPRARTRRVFSFRDDPQSHPPTPFGMLFRIVVTMTIAIAIALAIEHLAANPGGG